jgi:sphingolipid delta-4 desaturase
VGGTVNHTLHVLIHDFTHWAGHSSIFVNKVMAILCNIPMGFPSAISFGKYHADHHNFLGEKRKDPDLPLDEESYMSKSFIFKLMFVIAMSLVYAFRPLLFLRKRVIAD